MCRNVTETRSSEQTKSFMNNRSTEHDLCVCVCVCRGESIAVTGSNITVQRNPHFHLLCPYMVVSRLSDGAPPPAVETLVILCAPLTMTRSVITSQIQCTVRVCVCVNSLLFTGGCLLPW